MKTLQKLGLAAVLAASVSTAMANPDHHARYKFKADMSGAQIPSVTPATGDTTLKFANDLSSATYTLNTAGTLGNLLFAHFHCAVAGVNGAPVVTIPLANINAGPITITNEDITVLTGDDATTCGVTINNIASLLNATLQGRIYANVHTEAFPPPPLAAQFGVPGSPGELRGQIYPPIAKTRY